MRRILFVDDDKNVLHGLERGLRAMKDEWQMEFAASAKDALQALDAMSTDAVITDVRMPGMDGFELLSEASKDFPQVVRIVLSGQARQEAIVRSLGCTHLVLTKPCDTAILTARVRSALASSDIIRDQSLKSLVAQTAAVPSLSLLVAEVRKELQSADPSIDKVAQIVSMDMGMSAAVLHLVNSGYFGSVTVSSPGQAVLTLGLDTVRQLILSNSVCSAFAASRFQFFDMLTVYSDSMSTSTTACAIAMSHSSDPALSQAAFAAGLFHDVGQVVLAQTLGPFYDSIVERAISKGQPVWQAEREAIGSTHAEVGAYLLGLWGLPEAVVHAVAWHHSPSKSGLGEFSPLTAAHIADAVGHQWSKASSVSHAAFDENYLAKLGICGKLEDWIMACTTNRFTA